MNQAGGHVRRLPRPNWAGDVSDNLQASFAAFTADVEGGGNLGRPLAWSHDADQLAEALHQEAMRLGFSRAYEFSDDVFWADWASALVLFYAWGRGSSRYLQCRSQLQSSPRWRDQVALLDTLAPLGAQGAD